MHAGRALVVGYEAALDTRFFVLRQLLLTASLCLATLSALESAAAPGEAIDAILNEAAADGAGFAVIVERDGEIILDKGYGLANREQDRSFTTDTIAQIGSLTKQFTATAILVLAERLQVDLQAPLETYLPNVAASSASITLHQLLTHSAGLPEYCGSDFARQTRSDLLVDCLDTELLFAPGTDNAYSNVGYSVIAAVVETVSGQTVEDFLREEVLLPNGLESTGYLYPDSMAARLAIGYLDGRDAGNISDRIRDLGDDWWNLKGNGGMQASTRDMYQWYRVLNGEGRLPERVRAMLTTPHSPWDDGVAEGYGWFFRDDGTGRVMQMSHAGSDGVFFSYYWHRPEENVFLYFVGNSGEQLSVEVLRNVRSVLRASFSD